MACSCCITGRWAYIGGKRSWRFLFLLLERQWRRLGVYCMGCVSDAPRSSEWTECREGGKEKRLCALCACPVSLPSLHMYINNNQYDNNTCSEQLFPFPSLDDSFPPQYWKPALFLPLPAKSQAIKPFPTEKRRAPQYILVITVYELPPIPSQLPCSPAPPPSNDTFHPPAKIPPVPS